MSDYFKPKTWLITILMLIAAFGFSSAVVYYEFAFQKNIKFTSASASDNLSGWAWNEKLGWISFNCDHTSDNTLPPTNTCGAVNYGVNVNPANGDFSGYAWNSSVGWISFNKNTCVGGSDAGVFCKANNGCSSNNCSLGPGAAGNPPGQPHGSDNILADYNSGTGQVNGWAKILSLGDNGWIKLRKFSSDGGPDYGVAMSLSAPPVAENLIAPNWSYSQAGTGALRANPQFSFVDFGDGDFSGWAWNGGDGGLGWISFNCVNDGSCAAADYKVTGAGVNASSAGSAYQVIINTQNNTNSPLFDSGKCTGYNTPAASPVKCKIDISCLTNGSACQFPLDEADGLEYGTAYYWWVKVWDSRDVASAFVQYDTAQDTPYPEADNNANKTFTTYKHEFPRPAASYFTLDPSRGEEIKFVATSSQRFFSTPLPAAPYTPVYCQEDTCDWLWTAPNADITAPNASTTLIKFLSAGAQTVTLRVTDQGDTGNIPYYKAISIPVNVNIKLPNWKEVKPE